MDVKRDLYGLMVFENRVPVKTFCPKWKEVTEDWRTFRNGEFHD
jgi:hypothetical protein